MVKNITEVKPIMRQLFITTNATKIGIGKVADVRHADLQGLVPIPLSLESHLAFLIRIK